MYESLRIISWRINLSDQKFQPLGTDSRSFVIFLGEKEVVYEIKYMLLISVCPSSAEYTTLRSLYILYLRFRGFLVFISLFLKNVLIQNIFFKSEFL